MNTRSTPIKFLVFLLMAIALALPAVASAAQTDANPSGNVGIAPAQNNDDDDDDDDNGDDDNGDSGSTGDTAPPATGSGLAPIAQDNGDDDNGDDDNGDDDNGDDNGTDDNGTDDNGAADDTSPPSTGTGLASGGGSGNSVDMTLGALGAAMVALGGTVGFATRQRSKAS